MSRISPAYMQAQFHELKDERDAIRVASSPLRAQRDAIEAAARAQMAAIDARIREIEAPLHSIKSDMAAMARALNGKTGEPPAK